jgi:hypothetical protein
MGNPPRYIQAAFYKICASDGIQQHAAGHAAAARPQKGGTHLIRHTVFSPDIKLQVAEFFGTIDVATGSRTLMTRTDTPIMISTCTSVISVITEKKCMVLS